MSFSRCVLGTTTGNQGDVVVWGDSLVRSWNSPAPAGGALCGDLFTHNSASSAARQGIDIVEIPLSDPASASVIGFEPANRACHDTAVILGDANLAACAGHDGFTVWSLDEAKGGSLDDPEFLYPRVVPGVSVGHSASFSWDGEILVFGHEPCGGGVQARCLEASATVDKTLFFMDAGTGAELGRYVLPRPQTAARTTSSSTTSRASSRRTRG
jgi:hypothetical protein